MTEVTPDNAARDAVALMMKANAPFGWVKDEPASDGISAFTAREEIANKWRVLDCRVVTVYNLPHVAATLTALEAEVERLQFELDMARGHYEQQTAYAITHKGALRYCNSSMRDAYSDETVRADAAERRVAELTGLLSDSAGNLRRMANDEFAECDQVRLEHVVNRIEASLTGAGAK